jgi:hypothetical protein
MQGFPKHIATKADVDFLMSYLDSGFASQTNIDKGLAFLNELLNTKIYVFDKILSTDEDPTGSEPNYKVLEDQGDNNDERHQFVFTENPNANIYKVGLTVAEVQDYISQIEGAA